MSGPLGGRIALRFCRTAEYWVGKTWTYDCSAFTTFQEMGMADFKDSIMLRLQANVPT